MKKKYFLVWYTIAVVLFYSAAYLFIKHNDSLFTQKEESSIAATNLATPILSAWNTENAPEISASASVVIDAKSGAVVYEKNRDLALPMASTTKIMTAKIILDRLPLDQTVTVPKEAVFTEGSSVYLTENEEITVETLLYGLLLESGNDAAVTLAHACSGSSEEFAALMNSVAKEMGLISTSFANPHGLSAENHFTTAYELAYTTMCAMKNPKFREIVSTQKHIAPALDGYSSRYFFNHNKLLRTYEGAIGVKTGYTEAAGRCLVSAAQKGTEEYICVTLDDRNDWADHSALLDYAFGYFDSIEIAPQNGFAVALDGKRLCNTEPVFLTVQSGESPKLSYEITYNGENASVICFADGLSVCSFNLYPCESSPRK